MSNVPADRKYVKTHEWALENNDGTVTIGISDHAQDQLGDMVYVELPEVGTMLAAEDACAVVESVKAASDLYAPLAGEVVDVNEVLADSPELVNKDAFDDGWILKIRPENMADLDDLMDAPAYEALIESEDH